MGGRRKIIIFAAMLLMLLFVKNDVQAANVVASKTEGSISWTLFDDGLLSINGTGVLNGDNCSYKNYKSKVKRAEVGEGIISLEYAFNYFEELKSVSLPNTLETIKWGAFNTCSKLESVTLPGNLNQIGSYAFDYCHSLSEIIIPNRVTLIDYGAFSNCTNLTSVSIPDSVTTINSGAFSYCPNLKKVTVPDRFMNSTDIENIFGGSAWALGQLAPLNGSDGGFLYRLDADGTLTLTGSGTLLMDYQGQLYAYRAQVKKVVISDGTKELIFDYSWRRWEDFFVNIEKVINNSNARIRFYHSYGGDYSWCNANDRNERIYWMSKGTALRVNKKLDKHVKVIFNGNGATSGSMKPISVKVDTTIMLPYNSFVKTGHRFVNWKYSMGGTNYICNDGYSLYFSSYEVSERDVESVTLKAQWQGGTSKNVKSISLNWKNVYLNTKNQKTAKLVATVLPLNANQDVKWSSSKKTVATVSKTGVVMAIGKGTTTITATSANGKKATCKVTVTGPVNVAKVKLNKSKATIDMTKKTKTLALTATISPSSATDKSILWVSSKPEVATVVPNKSNKLKATVNAIKGGTTTITAYGADNRKGMCTITVKAPVKVKGVSLNKSSAEIRAKKSVTLKATFNPKNPTNKKVNWTSSDPKVATVSSKGKVTGKKVGKTTITVTTEDGKKTAQCVVTVTEVKK